MTPEQTTIAIDYNPFEGPKIQKVVPATEPQQEVWLSCIIGGDEANIAYNESLAMQFSGSLNPEAMKQALQELVSRHESLRASFSGDGSKMLIFEYTEPAISYFNISNESRSEQQKIIDAHIKSDAITPFDLTNGPLVRIALFRQSEDRYFLNFSTHHIVCDGWSFGILFEELSAIYNALCKKVSLPLLPEQFSSYAIESHKYLQTQEYHATENYWVNQFKNNVPRFEIPVDFERQRVRNYTSRRDDYFISKSLATNLKKAGAAHNCSFVTTLLSAFEVLIYKLTGNNDIVLGMPTAGQSATGMYNVIGHCVNLLPLRSRPAGNVIFSDYLKQRKVQTLQDYDHQRFTFGSLLKKINIQRQASRIPLLPVCFNIDIGMDMNVSFDGLDHTLIYNPRFAETFELFLNITDAKDGYVFQWSYNTSLYRKETIKGWMDKFVYLLEQVADNTSLAIDDYQLQNNDEVESSVARRNKTFRPLPAGNIVSLFEDAAARFPGNTAAEFDTQKKSYNEINNEANRLASFLKKQGLQKGSVAGLVLNRGPQLPIALLAILKCGAAYVPLDPDFPAARLQFMLQDSGASFIVVNKEYAGKFSGTAKEIILEDVEAAIKQMPAENPDIAIEGNDTAYIIYTSGSTGLPKGVMVTHHNLLNFLIAMQDIFETDEHTRLLAVTTISFDIAALEMYLPLISGGSLVIAGNAQAKDGTMLLEELVNNKINMMQATPATFKLMTDAGWEQKLDLTALCGGEALPKHLAEKLLTRVNSLYNMYGPTETTVWSTVARVKPAGEMITVGFPIANTQVYILDDTGALLPDGSIGEICIGGDGVAKGYHNRQELTQEKFITPHFKTAQPGKIYKTGDLGKILPNGEIVCLGRTDQQAKIRGFRIELGEIEHALTKQTGIKDAVCVVKEDDSGEQKLVAYIVTAGNLHTLQKETLMEWRAALRKTLPQYMVPAEFVKLDAFPLTPNKKVDRQALQKYTAGFTVQSETSQEEKNKTTDAIKQVWSKELGITGIDVDDDFFDLGGHSMTAVKVMNGIEKEIGIKLPIAVLFENPTVRSLAKVIGNNHAFNAKKVVIPIKQDGKKQPIFLVHAGGLNILLYRSLSQYLHKDQPLYGLQGLGLDGDTTHIKSIETVAARYLTEVKEHEPDGPYIIMGYSFGGIIAYEMAKQLIEEGKEVQILGMLDTYAKIPVTKTKLALYAQKSWRQFKKAAFFGRSFVTRPAQTYRYQKLILKRKFDKNFAETEDEQVYDYSPEVIEAYDSAYNNYVMQPLNVAIDLFRVKERIYYLDDPDYLGWKRYAGKGVHVHSIPGDHKTFLIPPNSGVLATILQDVVDAKTGT